MEKIYIITWFDDDEIQFEGTKEQCKEWLWNHVYEGGDEAEWPVICEKY